MSYINSYGIALPHFRIEDTTLHPKGKKGVTKAVCFSDEDIITLGFEAAKDCLNNFKFQISNFQFPIDGIFFATSTPVFHNRYHASFLADLLNLPQGILALDFTNSCRNGTDALLLANDLINSAKYKNILVIAADVNFPEIGKELSTTFGHAACAILVSHEKGFAEITNLKSFSSSLAEKFEYKKSKIQYDSRFSREEGFKNNLTFALKDFVSNPKLFDAVILNSLYSRMAGGIFAKAGFEENQFAKDSLTSKLGNTGSVHALLLLIDALESTPFPLGMAGDGLLLIDYTNGTNFFEVKSNDSPKYKSLQEKVSNYDQIKSYQDYLLLRKAGNFNSEKYETKEMFSSEMMQEREKETLLYLKGIKCDDCGTIYYLKSTRCKKCKCDKFSTIQLKNTGTVYTFTAEHYFPASFPPITMVVIDLEGGGRITVQQTDTMYPENNKLEIGSNVKLVLRKMIENDVKPNYFWKAIALRNTNEYEFTNEETLRNTNENEFTNEVTLPNMNPDSNWDEITNVGAFQYTNYTNKRSGKPKVQREDLIYPELCFQIVGILYDVYNELGYGHSEKVYQKAVAIALRNAGLKFSEQKYYPLNFQGEKTSSSFFDFLIEEIIVLELKKGDRFVKAHIDQVNEYLVSTNLKLGILAYFAPRNLHYKRIVNVLRNTN